MLSPTRLGRLARPTVTSANRYQNKYKVNNTKVSILSITVPQNRRRRWRRRQRIRNRQCVWGIGDSGTTTEAATSRWRAWGIGNHNVGVSRERWARGFDNDNRGVNWGSRRYNASKWKYLTVEAPVRLRAQGIVDDDGGVGRVRQARGLRDDDGGVGRGRGIYDASEGSDTTAEAAVDKRQARGIYDNNGGVGRGRRAQRLQ